MTIVKFMEAEKEWSKRQDLFFAKCAEWGVDHHGENVVDWGIVPDEIIDEGIDIYFGPTSDAEFYYDAVEKLDAGDYAQLIVNVVRNDTQNLDAAQELKKVIREALVKWIHDHVDSHVEQECYQPHYYDPDLQSREPY